MQSNSDNEATGERFMRFHALYREVVGSEFDALEFAEDDLYAFQVLDRAFRSDNQDLRNMAAHLQTQREAALETITMRATEINESTRRLKTLELKVLEQKGELGNLPAGANTPDLEVAFQPPPADAPVAPLEETKPAKSRARKSWFS